MDEHIDIGEPNTFSAAQAEELIAAALATGRRADLGGCAIAGELIVDLLSGLFSERNRLVGGLRLTNAIIVGGLDLSRRRIPVAIELERCRIEGNAFNLVDTSLDSLAIINCTVESALLAARLTTYGVVIFDGTTVSGPARLADARIAGPLSFAGATFAAGLDLARARIAQSVDLTDATLHAAPAALSLCSAHIDGDLLAERARISGGVILDAAMIAGAITARHVSVEHAPTAMTARSVWVARRIDLSSSRIKGALCFDEAKLGGAFEASKIEIDGGAISLSLARASVGGRLSLAHGGLVGDVNLTDTTIDGDVVLADAQLYATDAALSAQRMVVSGTFGLERTRVTGSVDLAKAQIAGSLIASSATLKVERHAALHLREAAIGGDLLLNSGLHTIGAVAAEHATVSGTTDLRGSHLRSVALAPQSGQPSEPTTKFDATDRLALTLAHANVAHLILPEHGDERPRGVVDLGGASIATFEDYAAAWPPVHRRRARDPSGNDIEHLILDGLTYQTLSNPNGRPVTGVTRVDAARARIDWLDSQRFEDCGPTLRRQPWIMLAGRLAAQSHSHEANRITIALHRRERRSRAMTAGERWTSRFADWISLYGLSPWRGLTLLVILTLLFAMVWAAAGARCAASGCLDESVFVITNKAAYTEPRFERTYPRFNALGYSLDLSLPVLSIGYRDHWRPNVDFGPLAEVDLPEPVTRATKLHSIPITTGGLLFTLMVIQQLLGLVLSLAIAAGLIGFIRLRAHSSPHRD